MTDRIKALTVHLDKDYREDDVQALVDAIGCLRGVAKVDLHVANGADYLAREWARRELIEQVWAVLKT